MLAWVITFIIYQKKKKTFDAGSIILLSYIIFALFSLLLYNNPYYGDKYQEMQFFPFMYLFLMLLLVLSPLLRYDSLSTKNIHKPNAWIINTTCVFFVVMSIITLPFILSNFKSGFLNLLQDFNLGVDLYREHELASYNAGKGISNISAIFINVLYEIVFLFFFYLLSLPRKNKVLIFFLGISIIINFAKAMSSGQRGEIVGKIFSLLLAYFAVRTYIPNRTNRKIRLLIFSLLLLAMIPISILTISRFATRKGGETASIVTYLGQQNLNFNNYGLDNGGIRYGDRTFPIFKRLLGFENVPYNYQERRLKYPNLHIDDYFFYTYVGDFTIDFGPILGTLVLIIISILFHRITHIRGDTILFHQLLILYLIMNLSLRGGLQLYPYADDGNLVIMIYIFYYFILKLDYDIQKRYSFNIKK